MIVKKLAALLVAATRLTKVAVVSLLTRLGS